MRYGRCPAAVLVMLLAAPLAARAHGVLPFGIDVLRDGEQTVGAMAAYGLLHREGGVLRWTPEEAMPGLVLWAELLEGGRVLAGTTNGVVSTDDWGCSWQPVEPLGARMVLERAVAPDAPARIYLPTADGVDDALYISADGGRSFARAWTADGTVERVAAGPGGRVFVLVVGARAVRYLFTSDDAGQTFAEVAIEGAPVAFDLVGLTADGQQPYLAWSLGGGRIGLFRLTDDGPVEVGDFAGSVVARAVEFGGFRFVLVDRTRLWRAALSGGAPAQVMGGPSFCLEAAPRGGRLWGCGQRDDGVHFFSTEDGQSWQGHLTYAEVCPQVCPDDAPATPLIAQFWEPVMATGVGGVDCNAVADASVMPDAAVDAAQIDAAPLDAIALDAARGDVGGPVVGIDQRGGDGCAVRPGTDTGTRRPRGWWTLALLAVIRAWAGRAAANRRSGNTESRA
ncbi:MAG: hypothetical protein KC620_17265 [Myxococcales bacterium]|nr:hypothetical protein [Myxococcales bacterium]